MFTIVSGVHILQGVLVTWCWLPGHCCMSPPSLPTHDCLVYHVYSTLTCTVHTVHCTQFLVSGDTGPLELGSYTTVSSRPHHIQDTGEKLLVSITRYLYHLELISANYNYTYLLWKLGCLDIYNLDIFTATTMSSGHGVEIQAAICYLALYI